MVLPSALELRLCLRTAPTLARLGPFSTADHKYVPQIRTTNTYKPQRTISSADNFLSGQLPQWTISSAENFLSGQFPQRIISSAPSSQSDRKRSGNWTCTKSVYELHLSCAKTHPNANFHKMSAAYLCVSGHLVMARNILNVFATFQKMSVAYLRVSGHLVILHQRRK